MGIKSYGNALTEKIFLGVRDKEVSRFPHRVLPQAERKLDMIEAAVSLQDLKSPPGNRLQRLSGHLQGFWCIRINDQWRIIFKWLPDGVYDVQVTDYH